ncbi:hypothetical protein IF2G_10883 [Cordyceps javanica]|nr:hypothetical protein IF2G_10883 [Cordyceps javanica]
MEKVNHTQLSFATSHFHVLSEVLLPPCIPAPKGAYAWLHGSIVKITDAVSSIRKGTIRFRVHTR